MEPKYRFRLYLLTAMVLVGCGTLLSRLHEFQIEKRSTFVANIPSTHTVSVREPSIRGEITDRNGIVIAQNRRSYEVVFNLDDIYQSWRQQHKERNEFQKEELVSGRGGVMEKRKSTDIVKVVNEWVIPRIESFGLGGKRFSSALNTHYKTHRGLVLFTYRTDLTSEEFAQFAERSLELPGVSVAVRPRRNYPYGTLACHLIGRVNQWKVGTIPDEFKDIRNMHFQGDDFGIEGIEATMNDYLQGQGGMKVYVRNEKNKIIALQDHTLPTEGAKVELTIDANIQHLVENVLRRIGRGAAVVMDPNTGEVLAMASVPNFDPNDFVPAIKSKNWQAYLANKANPFVNRAIQPYTPGSTFKLPTAIAAARHGRAGYEHHCIGHTAFGKLKIRCWKKGSGHGLLGLSESIQRSCNPYFMSLAGNLKGKAMVDTFHLIGLGRRSGIRLPNEDAGIVPGSPHWKREIAPGAVLTPATLAQMSIGQSHSMATPLQICSLSATIANGGRHYQPRVVRRVSGIDENGEQITPIENIPIVKVDLMNEGMTEQRMEIIRKGMWKATNEQGGTGGRAALKDVFIAAKTGTAQLGREKGDTHNAWTASFAPYDNPRYAVCVMVRNGGSGGKTAGVLTRLIYRGIFNIENGQHYRLTKMTQHEGHFDHIEEVELSENDEKMLAIAMEAEGETGNEIDAALLNLSTPIKVKPTTVALPTIAPTADAEIPTRAITVQE